MNLQEDLIYSLSVLGKLAYDSGFELFIVGGVPRNLVYRAVADYLSLGNAEGKALHESSIEKYPELKNLEKQMLTEPLGNDIDLLINTAALPWIS